MNKRFLLKEYHALCPNGVCNLELLTEEEKRLKNNGDIILTGVLQTAESKNYNGRIYPRKILEREIENYKKIVKERRSLGSLDHEESEELKLENVSHLILRIWWDRNDVMGVIKVLNTPKGRIAKDLINENVQLGISSRALGNLVETSEGSIVDETLEIISFDLVSTASNPKSQYLQLQESKNYENKIFTKGDRIYRCLNSILMSK